MKIIKLRRGLAFVEKLRMGMMASVGGMFAIFGVLWTILVAVASVTSSKVAFVTSNDNEYSSLVRLIIFLLFGLLIGLVMTGFGITVAMYHFKKATGSDRQIQRTLLPLYRVIRKFKKAAEVDHFSETDGDEAEDPLNS